MAYSTREEERKRQRDMLISVMESTKPRTIRNLKITVEKAKIKNEKNRRKFEKMPEEEFIRVISGDIFGVASKGFYLKRFDDNVKDLENAVDRIEYMVEQRCKGSIATDYIEKREFEGRMKESLVLLDEFTPKICRCINKFVKENNHKYRGRDGYILSGGKKEKQMLRDARKACE